MPKVVMMSEAERRNIEISARIEKLMRFNRMDRGKLAKVLNVSRSTVDNMMRAPGTFLLSEIWTMEKYFGCCITEPLIEKGGVFDEEPNH